MSSYFYTTWEIPQWVVTVGDHSPARNFGGEGWDNQESQREKVNHADIEDLETKLVKN